MSSTAKVNEEELRVVCKETSELLEFSATLWNGVLRELYLKTMVHTVGVRFNTLYETEAVTKLTNYVLDRASMLLRNIDEAACRISYSTETKTATT